MRIPLNVKFEEKVEAKNNGVKWDKKNKIWYLWDYKYLSSVNKWLNPDFNIYITENIYLVSGCINCWKCNKTTKVHSIGADKFVYFDEQWKYYSVFYLIKAIELYSNNLSEVLELTEDKFTLLFSNASKTKYLTNTCEHCNNKQGNSFLYNEEGAIFSPLSRKQVENMIIEDIPLDLDIGLKGRLYSSYGSGTNSNVILWNGSEHQ